MKTYSLDKNHFDVSNTFLPLGPLTLLVFLSFSLRILRLTLAVKFHLDTEAVWIAISSSALKNCVGVGLLIIGVKGMGRGCRHSWSPEVPGAEGVGGGFAGVCMRLVAGMLDYCPFDDGTACSTEVVCSIINESIIHHGQFWYASVLQFCNDEAGAAGEGRDGTGK